MKLCDVATEIFVNISCITNCIDPVIESHKRIFSLFARFVTSISHLHLKFIIKAIFGEKEMLGIYIHPCPRNLGNRTCAYASDFGHMSRNKGKLHALLEISEVSTYGFWVG